ncbi:MAG: Ig-like domain-containing protein, partial [Pseudomonadota bacterium]|nr:Ig-like domain-containing protein [Pseudomonadota bacterium]
MTATFSEVVIVDNSSANPTLTLTVGSTNRTATYASGGNSTDLVYRYTIQSGEIDSNGISIGADSFVLPNSSTISDLAGNNAILTHDTVDNNSSYKVNATTFSVTSFTMSDTELKIGDNATVTLVFSEKVLGFSSDDDITIPNLDNGTPTGTLSTMTSSDNETWTGTFIPATNAEDNSSRLSLGTGYTDLAGNTGPDNETANYEIDTLAPTVTSVRITSADGDQNSFLNAGDNVSVTATFSEAVNLVNTGGNPTLTLLVGSDNETATYASGSGSANLVFRYTIQSGDNDTNGISIRANALYDNGSTIRDVALNDAILTHSAVDNNTSYKVDTLAPTVS